MSPAPLRRPRASTRVAIALGSNLGDRHAHVRWAVRRLHGLLTDGVASRPTVTAPVEVPDPQPDYVNAVIVGRTSLAPRSLLAALLRLEDERGRVRRGPKSARTLDVDLILFGSSEIREPGLVVPHPRFRQRAFVLEPLARLAPRWRDPVTGRTMSALWRAYSRSVLEAEALDQPRTRSATPHRQER